MAERRDCECGHDAAMHTAVLLGGPDERPCWAATCPCHRYREIVAAASTEERDG